VRLSITFKKFGGPFDCQLLQIENMTKTVFITGASSGIGRSTALYFQKQGWNVAATMRSPDQELDFRLKRRKERQEVNVTNCQKSNDQ
jgi:NADP-dependent 3-hydroxy acid dehydrogenase YdfG